MKVVYRDIVTKKTKEFVFKVEYLNDGSYRVTQQSLRILPDQRKKVVSEKIWNYAGLEDMRHGEYVSSRQGKVFMDSQFWEL